MRLASVSNELVGCILSRPVLDDKGLILLGEGVQLSERLIDRLRAMGVYSVYIQDALTDDVVVEDAISDKTRRMAIHTVQQSVEQLKTASTRNPRMASRHQLGQEFSQVFQEILGDIQSSQNALVSLASIYTMDGYLYHHAINVTVLATVMGLAKGYNQKQLTELGVGTLLRDIGMLRLPNHLITKKGSYSPAEFQIMQQHAVWGYEYLKEQDGVSTLSAHIALQHHERLDGSGYPRGLKGNDIHEYARIVAICDVFDAMSTSRQHRQAFLPHDSLEYLMAGSVNVFDPSLVTLFLKNVAVYPIGLTVTLNNGQTAVVVQVNPEYPQRPKVRPIPATDGTLLDRTEDIDLTKQHTLMITGVN